MLFWKSERFERFYFIKTQINQQYAIDLINLMNYIS